MLLVQKLNTIGDCGLERKQESQMLPEACVIPVTFSFPPCIPGPALQILLWLVPPVLPAAPLCLHPDAQRRSHSFLWMYTVAWKNLSFKGSLDMEQIRPPSWPGICAPSSGLALARDALGVYRLPGSWPKGIQPLRAPSTKDSRSKSTQGEGIHQTGEGDAKG